VTLFNNASHRCRHRQETAVQAGLGRNTGGPLSADAGEHDSDNTTTWRNQFFSTTGTSTNRRLHQRDRDFPSYNY